MRRQTRAPTSSFAFGAVPNRQAVPWFHSETHGMRVAFCSARSPRLVCSPRSAPCAPHLGMILRVGIDLSGRHDGRAYDVAPVMDLMADFVLRDSSRCNGTSVTRSISN